MLNNEGSTSKCEVDKNPDAKGIKREIFFNSHEPDCDNGWYKSWFAGKATPDFSEIMSTPHSGVEPQ